MSAEWQLRQAVLQALRSDDEILARVNGIFDERPITASAPYIELLNSISTDWSSKSFEGREVRLSIALRSAAQEDAPDILSLDLIEQSVLNLDANIPIDPPQFKIINRQYIRSRSGHDADGRWTIIIEFRVRMQRISHT